MSPENVKKLLILVSSFLVIFLAFFFLFWRPKVSRLRTYQEELSSKQAELIQLERDARDWPDSITRERLDRYEEELERLLNLIPSEEEVAMLLNEIQTHARSANLEIISLIRTSNTGRTARERAIRGAPAQGEEGPKYVRVPYQISLGGSYFGLIKFLRRLEDSRRLVNVTNIKMNVAQGGSSELSMEADIQFNIFYSRVGVGTG